MFLWLQLQTTSYEAPGRLFQIRVLNTASSSLEELDALDVPALLRVVVNGTVRAELAHLRGRADALLDPLDAVLVRLVHERERRNVCPSTSAPHHSH